MNVISSFYQKIVQRPEVKAMIPMGYTPGIPTLAIKQDNLCLVVPFVRYKITGEKDKTLVFPIRYVAEYILPECVLVKFEDLAYSPLSGKVDFEKPCGLFRHKAIENLSKAEYNNLRNSTLESFDKVTDVLLDGKPYSVADLELMKSQLQRIVEPSLWSFYRILSPDFYTKYFTANGKD